MWEQIQASYTLLAAMSNPQAQVFSFEPYLINQTRLLKNITLNGLNNIEVINKAIGNQNNKIKFGVPAQGGICDTSSANLSFAKSTYRGEIKWKEIEVDQISLDTFIQNQKLAKVDLLKVDVEGYETSVFEGAQRLFQDHRPYIFCEIFLGAHNREYFEKLLQQHNYYVYMLLKEGIVSLGKGIIPNPDGLNFLFSPIPAEKVYLSYKEMPGIVNTFFPPHL
ncbi:MAG: FkbM family methyltransferase [Bacteroidia bacterium]|nr:FkbM family methyltransferase [Bacteroidia bacterium]